MESEMDELRGRLVAVEMLVTGFLVKHAHETFGQRAAEELKRQLGEMRAGLQHMNRPIDDRSDRAWEAAAETFQRLEANALARLAAIEREDG